MIKNVYEILDEFRSAKTKAERIEVLQKNASNHFQWVLKYTFDPTIEFYVNEFPHNYIEPDTFPGIRYAGIESEIKRAYLFIKGNETADRLTEQKRNQILVQMLEAFEPKEATIFINMMKKDLKVPFLTKTLVQEAIPGLLQ
jgi:hypothetical protein